MSLTAEQIEKSFDEFLKLKANIDYIADGDQECIDFYINGALAATWAYVDDPESSLEDFCNVLWYGWLARQETLCVELPDEYGYDGGKLDLDEVREAIEAAGIAHK